MFFASGMLFTGCSQIKDTQTIPKVEEDTALSTQQIVTPDVTILQKSTVSTEQAQLEKENASKTYQLENIIDAIINYSKEN